MSRHYRLTCRYCRRKDEAHRLAHFNARVTAHPECWLAQGGDIAGLSDSTIMNFSRRTCIRLGLIDDGAAEHARLQEQALAAAGVVAALAARPAPTTAAKKGPSTSLRSAWDDGGVRGRTTRELRSAA